jgi:hypothetical protein
MTYTQAKLKIEMPETYDPKEVREAAAWLLARFDLSQEDFDRASFVLFNIRRGRKGNGNSQSIAN